MRVTPFFNNGQLDYLCQEEDDPRYMELPPGSEYTHFGPEPIDVGTETWLEIRTGEEIIWTVPIRTDSMETNGRYDLYETAKALAKVAKYNLEEEEDAGDVIFEYQGEVLYKGNPITVTYDEVIDRDLDYYQSVIDIGADAQRNHPQVDITDSFVRAYARESR